MSDADPTATSPAAREARLRAKEALACAVLTAMAFAGHLVAVTDLHPAHGRTVAVACVFTAVLGAVVVPRGRPAINAIVRTMSAALLSLLFVFGALGTGAVRVGVRTTGCGPVPALDLPVLHLHYVGAYIEGPLLVLSLVALFVTRRSRPA